MRFGIIVLGVTAGLTLAACNRYGTGGTGELVVPQQQLRQITGTQMERLATTRPTTAPATRPTTAPAVPPPEVRLSIEEVRQLALQNNLDLKVDLLNPTIAKEAVNEEEARFESVFTTDASYGTTDSPTASQLNSAQATDFRVTPGIQVPLRTGGTVSLNAPYERLSTNNSFSTLNPSYSSDLAASISHPLLRGAGIDVNAQRIRIAFYQYQQSQARTKLEIIRVLADADRVYWRLYAARRALEVRKKEYDLALVQLERARRMVKIGAGAEPDVVRAESGVADRLEAIILAENLVRDRQRDMKRILNTPGLQMDSPTIVIPTSEPNPLYYRLNAQQLVQVALNQRMEMLEVELQLAAEASNVRFARNEMLPLVSLQYTYNINGLGSTPGDALEMLSEKDYEDHFIGVRMEVPIGNEAARSRLRRALANRLQQLRTKEQRSAQIEQEVLNAIDQLEANYQRILAAQQRVILAARVLEVEVRQFTLGLRTSTDVLNAQAELAAAQLSEINALAEYQIAQVDIAFATGTLLGATHVLWEPAKAPGK